MKDALRFILSEVVDSLGEVYWLLILGREEGEDGRSEYRKMQRRIGADRSAE